MRLAASEVATELLRVELLGGFRVVVGSRMFPAEAWRLREAAALVKLLAWSTAPSARTRMVLAYGGNRDEGASPVWPPSPGPSPLREGGVHSSVCEPESCRRSD